MYLHLVSRLLLKPEIFVLMEESYLEAKYTSAVMYADLDVSRHRMCVCALHIFPDW